LEKDEPFGGYNILFLPDLLENEFALLSSVSSFVDFYFIEPFIRKTYQFLPRFSLAVRERSGIRMILEQLTAEFQRKQPAYQVLVKTKMIELFIQLSRSYGKQKLAPVFKTKDDEEMLGVVRSFIEQHYNQPLSLEQVSRFCSVSASSFKIKFKQHTGLSFVDYRNAIRLKAAEELLARTGDKIIAVAEQVGFRDLSHFNRSFKKKTGMSPREYRLANKESQP
jgi:AraC-like DNA-binding protein